MQIFSSHLIITVMIGYISLGIICTFYFYDYIDNKMFGDTYTSKVIKLLNFLFNSKGELDKQIKEDKIRKTIFELSLYDLKNMSLKFFPKPLIFLSKFIFTIFLIFTWIISIPLIIISYLIYYRIYIRFLYKENRFYKKYFNKFIDTYTEIIENQIIIKEEKYTNGK